MNPTWSLRRLSTVDDSQIDALTDVLIDCVDGGASVSFMLPLTRDRAVAFWRRVAQGVAAGERALLVADDQQGICGTVQLTFDLPENQPHRADLAKMLVHRRVRRQGLGAALMKAAEELARQCGKTLLVLDAVTYGDAARLYERLGWVRVGDVPNFALMPRGEHCSTTYYYRNLEPPVVAARPNTNSSTKERGVDMHIRDATESDLPAIVDIYNQSIPAGWSTADTKPIAVADRVEWFRKFDPSKRPIWVAEVDGQVVATSYLSSFYGGRPAYDATAEASIYVATAYHRRGIGRRFKQWVIEQCPRLGVTTLLSMHFDHNEGTRRINESLGFKQLGHLTEIAVVQGQKRGLVIWSLRIPTKNAQATTQPASRSEDILSRQVLSTVPLRDGRQAELAYVVESDAAAVLDYVERIAAETDFATFGAGEFGLTYEQERAFLRTLADGSQGLMIKATIDGVMVGNALLGRSTRPRIRHVADLGLSVRREFWGYGLGRALCQTIFCQAKQVGVTRIALRVRADNARAIHLYESLGFAHEGRLVGSFVASGVSYDELTMGLQIQNGN